MTRWQPLFLGLSVLLLLLWRLPRVIEAFWLNQAAVAATAACSRQAAAPNRAWLQRAQASHPAQVAWLKVAVARCRGDEPAVRAALQEVLAASDARLDLVRAIAPEDEPLAQLAASTYPEQAEAHLWLGDALAKAEQTDRAIAEYEHGLALQPTNANTWFALGGLYEAQGDIQAAARAYDQACRYVDRAKNGCVRAGQMYLQLEQYDQALDRYQTSLRQIGYTFLPSEQGLATALLALGRTGEAIPHLQILAENGSADARQTLQQLQPSSTQPN